MKKLTALLAAFLFVTTFSAFAFPAEKVKEEIVLALKEDFNPTSAISWQFENEHYVATFQEKSVKMVVAYDEAGELIAAAKYVSFASMPTSIKLAINRRYSNATISSSVIELLNAGSTSYFVTVVHKNKLLRVEATPGGYLSVVEKKKI